MSEETYDNLIQWLNKAWFGLPDSEHLLPPVKAFYSEEEAELLTGLPFKSTALEGIAKQKSMEPLKPAQKLEALARRGALWRSQKGDTTYYKINDAFFVFLRGPFWSWDPDEKTKRAARPINSYFYDGFMDQFRTAHTKGLRTIPIDKTVEDPRRILPYEDVVQFVETQDYWTVSNCPCRQRKKLDSGSTWAKGLRS